MTVNMIRSGALFLIALTAVMAGCSSTPATDESSSEEAGLLADVRTERELLRQIAETPQLAGETITANVIGGTAVLSGTVRSSVEREMAEQVARSANGILQVTNNLTTEN